MPSSRWLWRLKITRGSDVSHEVWSDWPYSRLQQHEAENSCTVKPKHTSLVCKARQPNILCNHALDLSLSCGRTDAEKDQRVFIEYSEVRTNSCRRRSYENCVCFTNLLGLSRIKLTQSKCVVCVRFKCWSSLHFRVCPEMAEFVSRWELKAESAQTSSNWRNWVRCLLTRHLGKYVYLLSCRELD